MAIIFGRTQLAIQTPFEPNRVTIPFPGGTGIDAINVQDAIEEAKLDAISNDRFLILASYNGNANVGRYLEFFPNIASDTAPILSPQTSIVTDVICATTSASETCTIEFVDLQSGTPVVLFTQTFSGVKRVISDGSPALPLFAVPANAQIAIRVGSGSINRPHIYFYLSAST